MVVCAPRWPVGELLRPSEDKALPVTLEKVSELLPLVSWNCEKPLPATLATKPDRSPVARSVLWIPAAEAAVLMVSTTVWSVDPAASVVLPPTVTMVSGDPATLVTCTVTGRLPPLMVKVPVGTATLALLKTAVPVPVPDVKVSLFSSAVDMAWAALPSPDPTPEKGVVGAGIVLLSVPTGSRLEFFSMAGLTLMVPAELPPVTTSLRWKKLEKSVPSSEPSSVLTARPWPLLVDSFRPPVAVREAVTVPPKAVLMLPMMAPTVVGVPSWVRSRSL